MKPQICQISNLVNSLKIRLKILKLFQVLCGLIQCSDCMLLVPYSNNYLDFIFHERKRSFYFWNSLFAERQRCCLKSCAIPVELLAMIVLSAVQSSNTISTNNAISVIDTSTMTDTKMFIH